MIIITRTIAAPNPEAFGFVLKKLAMPSEDWTGLNMPPFMSVGASWTRV